MIRILPLALLFAAAPIAAQGRIEPGGDREGVLGDAHHEVWTFPGEAGQTYFIAVRSDDFVPALRVGSTDGADCADCVENDPSESRATYAFVQFRVPRTRTYAIRVVPREPGATGRYQVTMNLGIMRDPVDVTRAAALADGEPVSGELREGDGEWRGTYADVYTFEGRAGDTVVLAMESGDFAPFGLVEYAATGEYVGANDFAFDPALVLELPYDGTYAVTATAEEPGERGRYTLSLRRRR